MLTFYRTDALTQSQSAKNLKPVRKLTYWKHHLNDASIGWIELGDCLLNALYNEMGDDGLQEWLRPVGR